MTKPEIYDVAVIGGGGAGQMAMLRGVLNHLHTLVFLGSPKTIRKSRATWVDEVDNIPGFFDKRKPITATGREVQKFIQGKEDLAGFLTLIRNAADQVEKKNNIFVIRAGEVEYQARHVVLATGTMDRQPEIAGSIEPIFPYANRGDVLYCIRCDGHRTVGHKAAVIGHRGVAGWIAVMLKERYDLPEISVLTHGKSFEGSNEVKALLKKYNISIEEGVIEEVLGDPKQGLSGFKLADKTVSVTKAFVALGSIVYNELAKQVGANLSERDHVLVNEDYETSVPGFFAVGDLVEGKKKQVYTAWDMAVDAVDAIDEKIRIQKRENQYSLS